MSKPSQHPRLRRAVVTCRECGKKMRRTIQSYQYRESGLSNVYLYGVALYVCRCGEEMLELPLVQKLHSVIVQKLIQKHSPLKGDEFRFIRKFIGLRAIDIAEMLDVEPETVSRWENEHKPIGGANDQLFRLRVLVKMAKTIKEQAEEAYKRTSNLFLDAITQVSEMKASAYDEKVSITAEELDQAPLLFYPANLPHVEVVA